MSKKFWRFAYSDEMLYTILASNRLVFPDLSRWPLAKNNAEKQIIDRMDKGDFILLSNFNQSSGFGTVRGVGKIRGLEGDQVLVLWKRPVPSWSLSPNRQGGEQQWIREGVFCFDPEPAKRYKLGALTQKLFQDAILDA
jgi:hypothetical protein